MNALSPKNMTSETIPPHLTGANFLLADIEPDLVFTPEDLSLEERQMAETTQKFMDKEVFPVLEQLEHHEEGLARKLFEKAGELGLLGIEVPETYGGLGLGKTAHIGVQEQLARLAGFAITCSAHSGIGSQPLIYFGTDAQKQKYLPRLASGEWMSAYCLSETGSGSDALGMKAKAVLSADGQHYVLNGVKMWITNAAWADLFTVFAKVDGEHVTAFLVERTFPGVSTGKEEHKLGIKSSSTRRVILEDVKVPVENVLGEVGKGAYIAFNILNFGRYSLAAANIGSARDQIRVATRYALERHQFGKPLVAFGLIQQKLADMAAKVFAGESGTHRTAGMIDAMFATGEMLSSMTPHFARALDEFALECSVLKVICTEILFEVADESLQIHGGYGFTEEFSPARALRDSRINRIFEGTNEINRLFIPTWLMRREQRGRFPLTETAERVFKELANYAPPADTGDGLENARVFLAGAKKLVFFLSGVAGRRFGPKIADEQEVLAPISDVISQIYLGESAVLRALKTRLRSRQKPVQTDLALLFVNESAERIEAAARRVLEACVEQNEFAAQLKTVRRLLPWPPLNSVALRRQVAQQICTRGGYPA
jgi:alkylation response protein AidB-like acyl-CoA dehydrogenase